MLPLNFWKQEQERIANLRDNEARWQAWCDHYWKLTPKEQAVVQYLLSAAKKVSDAEEYLGVELGPITCVAQKEVNNGFGMMFSINRDCFLDENVKMFYVRSDMWIPPNRDPSIVPEWISNLADGCKRHSSGLAKVRPEVMQYAFDDQPPSSYYAITFQLELKQIRKSIRIADVRWWPEQIGSYLFTLLDITGEYDYAIGELHSSEVVTLWRESMDFD